MADENAKPAAKPQAKPAAKPVDPKPAAAAVPEVAADDGLPQKSWDCWIPEDRMAGRRVVQAATSGDAKEKYLKAIGANKTEHSISAIEIVASGDVE